MTTVGSYRIMSHQTNLESFRIKLLHVAMSVLQLLSIDAALRGVHYAGVFFNRSLGCYTTGWPYLLWVHRSDGPNGKKVSGRDPQCARSVRLTDFDLTNKVFGR